MNLRVGLDIGGTKIAALAVDQAGNPRGSAVRPTDAATPDRLISGVVDIVDLVLQDAGLPRSALVSAGIGIPGQIEPVNGTVSHAVNLNLREPYPLRATLQKALGIPVVLENDVRAAAWGAYHWACASESLKSLAYLSIGTGIAAGLILDGHLYRGAHGMAGEIGHIPMDSDGPRCSCGSFGCLEALAAGPAVAARAAESLRGSGLSTYEVYKLAATNPQAGRVVAQTAGYLSRAVLLLLMAYDVEKVVIGGGVSRAGEAFEQPLRQAMADLRSHSPLVASMMPDNKVVIISPDYNAGVMGAVYLAPDRSPEARQEDNEKREDSRLLTV
ncbi:MAG: ROK family protein [Anaerolineae bacterium]|nr:ROK family protein [Anaerolineae bacterium]